MSVKLIPERLSECRKKLGINKLEASQLIGLTQSGYLKYEAGDRKPTIHVAKAIAYAFNTSVDYLIGISDDPSPDCLVVSKKQNPILFTIASDFDALESAQQKRVLSYYLKIKDKSSP